MFRLYEHKYDYVESIILIKRKLIIRELKEIIVCKGLKVLITDVTHTQM